MQKESQKLAFNIQTHDTIKYTPRNLSSELDRALRDAAKITKEEREKPKDTVQHSRRLFIRSFEIMGYKVKESDWFLSDEFEDVSLTPFGHPEKEGYVFLAVEDDRDSLANTLTDMQVIIKRLETKHDELQKQKDSLDKKLQSAVKTLEELEKEQTDKKVGIYNIGSRISRVQGTKESDTEKRNDISSRIELIENSKFAIVLLSNVIEFKDRVFTQYENLEKGTLNLPLFIGDISGIQVDNINVSFKPVTL
jgi:chaperonin cofactor prefoldin